MLTFFEWLNEIRQIENQETLEKWDIHYIFKIINRYFKYFEKRPQSWQFYNLPYWEKNKEKLLQLLIPVAQDVYDNFSDSNGVILVKDFDNGLFYGISNIFQRGPQNLVYPPDPKGPFTRRHITYAKSLNKHPNDVDKRKVGNKKNDF